MRAILIDPTTKTVSLVTLEGHKPLHRLIGCARVELVTLSNHDDMYVDEEGLLADDPGPFWCFEGYADRPYCGKAVIAGHDEEGNTAGTMLAVQQVFRSVEWLDLELAGFEEIDEEAVFMGKPTKIIGSKAVYRPRRDICTDCYGCGIYPSGQRCRTCDGSGKVLRSDEDKP
jgi:hypothetical protein